MILPRRDFISTVSMAATGTCLHAPRLWNSVAPWGDSPHQCALLNLGDDCVLPESLLGYQRALTATPWRLAQFEDAKLPACRNVIVPAAGCLSEFTAERILRCLNGGTNVLLESAAGFGDSSRFAGQQRILRDYFDVIIEPPINLWSPQRDCNSITQNLDGRVESFVDHRAPYIDYVWPAILSLRDFSKVIPIRAAQSEVIAHCDSQPVAVKKALAQSTLVFLGSPLGPGLHAGEPEAHSLLRLLISSVPV